MDYDVFLFFYYYRDKYFLYFIINYNIKRERKMLNEIKNLIKFLKIKNN